MVPNILAQKYDHFHLVVAPEVMNVAIEVVSDEGLVVAAEVMNVVIVVDFDVVLDVGLKLLSDDPCACTDMHVCTHWSLAFDRREAPGDRT